VGSSYIHFNFTPQQDKATASLLGDVPHGVTLKEDPIFLGGQGGLVGPAVIAFGTVTAAGTIWRRDQKKPGRLVVDGVGKRLEKPYTQGMYRSVKRIVQNNVEYMANLVALLRWYVHVRAAFARGPLEDALHQGLVENVKTAIDERIRRFYDFCEKAGHSARLQQELSGGSDTSASQARLLAQKKELYEKRDALAETFRRFADQAQDTTGGEHFLCLLPEQPGQYLEFIQSLAPEEAGTASVWLSAVVSDMRSRVMKLLGTIG